MNALSSADPDAGRTETPANNIFDDRLTAQASSSVPFAGRVVLDTASPTATVIGPRS